ncbi:hypothetical protein SAMN03159343_0269 [Klenkia marina]|uniref:Uncharacterized protein n=1 Tax=Klenkia marina TaxID=1960309 RepID=A0A1G4XA07_9ACTN|nr:hypothetical protein [Klenkia marina]SCX38017.1 hypothetical protein SAMN03159343_0269 [Klenkia marina]
MSRRGWVSAEDAAGDRWRLAVDDDGWVEQPQPIGDSADPRPQLLFLLGGFGVLVLLSLAAGRLDGVGGVSGLVLAVVGLCLLLFSAVRIARFRARGRQHPGRRVRGEQISAVVLTGPEHPGPAEPLVVSVLLHDGSTLTYRTPDATARRLFAPWGSVSGPPG